MMLHVIKELCKHNVDSCYTMPEMVKIWYKVAIDSVNNARELFFVMCDWRMRWGRVW